MLPSSHANARLSRRQFLIVGSAAVAVPLFAGRAIASATLPLRVGLIGGDSDGISLLSRALRANGNFQLMAIADEVGARAQRTLDIFTHPMRRGGPHPRVMVSSETLFVGDDAAARLCAMDRLDAVLVAGIPAFRPTHVNAAIAAGKHVFMLGPGAIDATGCLILERAARQAEQVGLAIGVDLSEDGGQLLGPGAIDVRWQRAPWRRPVVGGAPVTNWYFEPSLSGGALLTEGFQTIDRLNQIKGSIPLLAEGHLASGTEDYSVRFVYPDGSHVAMHLTLGDGLPTVLRVRSADGTALPAIPAGGASQISTFLDRVRLSQAWGWRRRFDCLVTSTQTAILGRDAARAGRLMAWNEVV